MQKVKAGDLDQLGLLFERYHRVLFSFFYHLNQSVELSEDLVQNVFLRVLKYRHNFRGDGEFKSWLFHIARNVNYDHHRRYRQRHVEDVEAWKDRLPDESPGRQQEMIQEEEMEKLKMALRRLEPEKREVIVLSKLKGMKYREIGQVLGCTEGAVKVKVYRALRALKAVYGDLEKS